MGNGLQGIGFFSNRKDLVIHPPEGFFGCGV